MLWFRFEVSTVSPDAKPAPATGVSISDNNLSALNLDSSTVKVRVVVVMFFSD